jgi:AcrR family transcriptional regulator
MAGIESRRQAVLEAMLRVVGRKGYREATVADTIAEAGVSRTTFYKHFPDKHECFLAAYELAAERVLAAVKAECDSERPWLERVRAGLASLVELLTDEPELARAAIVEAVVAGVETRQRQLAAIGQIAELLETGRAVGARGEVDGDGAAGESLPASTALMATGATAGLLFDEIQAGRTAALPQHLPELLFALLVPYLGPGEAAAAIPLRDRAPAGARPAVARGWAGARLRR